MLVDGHVLPQVWQAMNASVAAIRAAEAAAGQYPHIITVQARGFTPRVVPSTLAQGVLFLSFLHRVWVLCTSAGRGPAFLLGAQPLSAYVSRPALEPGAPDHKLHQRDQARAASCGAGHARLGTVH